MKKLEVSWMGEESVKTLLSKTNENNGKKVIRSLNGFLDFLNSKEGQVEKTTPDLLISDAKKEDGVDRAGTRIESYFKWLQGKPVEGYPAKVKPILPMSAKEQAYSKVTSFYHHNKIVFDKITPDLKEGPKTLGADKRNEILRLDETTDELIFDKEPIKRFLDSLKLRDKTIALCMLSSSQDSGDVLALDLKYIRLQKDRKRFFFDNSRAKTNVEFRTFFTVEASSYLRRYMEVARKDAEDDKPLFVVGTNGNGKRMTTDYLGTNFAYAARTAGFEWEDDEVNPMRGKRLRHVFQTACEHVGIEKLFIHKFMGHTLDTNEKYAEISQAVLEKQYKKVEPYLTIYSGDETTAVMQKQLDELEKEKEAERQSRDALRMKNDVLEGRVMTLESEQRVMNDKLGDMELRWKQLEQEIIKDKKLNGDIKDREGMSEEETEDATQWTPPKDKTE